jgi:hypothetical protein
MVFARMRARAEWRRRWPSLLALTLLVAVAGGVTLTALAGARRTRGATAAFHRQNGTADIFVELGQIDTFHGVDKLAAIKGVERVTRFGFPSILPYTKEGRYLPLLGAVDDRLGTDVERGILIDGRRPRADASDEIALSVAHAALLGARVGDEIPFIRFDKQQAARCLFGDEEPEGCDRLFATPNLNARVVGVVRTGNDLVQRQRDVSISIASQGFYERHRDDAAWYTGAFVELKPEVRAQDVVAEAERLMPDAVFTLPNESSFSDAVGVLAVGLALFGVVAGVAGLLTVAQAVRRQAVRTLDDESTLAALGATTRVRAAGVLAVFVPVAGLGTALALLAAWLASGRMPIGLARRADPGGGLSFDAVVLGLGAAVAVVVILAVAAAAALRAGRLARERARPMVGARASTRVTDPRAALGMQLATARGTGRETTPVRSATAAAAVAIAGITATLGFAAGLHHLVRTPALYGWAWDVTVEDDDVVDEVLADPGVDAVANFETQIPLHVNGTPTLAMSVTPVRGEIGPAIVDGRAPSAPDEVALGRKTMDRVHLGIGDEVVVRGSEGELTMRVVGRGVFPTGNDGYPLADGAYVTPKALSELGRGEGVAQLAVTYRTGTDSAATYTRLAAIQGRGEADPENPEIAPDLPEPPMEIENLRRVESLPFVLAGFLALLGTVAVAHALLVGVRRRARDFATLRALGFRPRDVGLTIAWQSVVLGAVASVVGVPAGVLIGRLAWRAVAERTGVLVVHRVSVLALLVIVPIAMLVAVGAALFPARRASRLRPAEILRSE